MKRLLASMLIASMLFSLVCCNKGEDGDHMNDTETEKIETSETETETDTEVESDTGDDSEPQGESSTSGESESVGGETEETDNISPLDGELIILANEDVYGWWDDYHYKKTGYTEPFYLHKDIYYPEAVTFSWDAYENADYYRLFISTDKDFAEDKTESYLLSATSLTLEHLYTGTVYYWQVIATSIEGEDLKEVNAYAVSPRSFTTAESPRCIKVEGVSNTRDIGGLKTQDGKRIKQGMVYRGGKLNDITDYGKEVMLDYLGIKTDLDLRTPGEGGAGGGSPLGSDVKYVLINGRYYTGGMGITSDEGKAVFAEEIRLFADPNNYPVYIHCSLGRDRTGTLAFVLEALLGVAKNDLIMEYELSAFSVTGTLDNAGVGIKNQILSTFDYINNNYEGATFAEKTENYLLDIGITAEEIETIRSLLLEEVN